MVVEINQQVNQREKIQRKSNSISNQIAKSRKTDDAFPFSVEIFPPKSEERLAKICSEMSEIKKLDPAYVSVTYGAGGGTRVNTHTLANTVALHDMTPLVHLTAVRHTIADLLNICESYKRSGLNNILALRGDPPGDPMGKWIFEPGGFQYASELVKMLNATDFDTGVASFPEGHFRAASLEQDTRNLVTKLRLGASYSITQMFFSVDHYLRLRDRVTRLDTVQAEKPIIPTVMPVVSTKSLKKMLTLSGGSIPEKLLEKFEKAESDDKRNNSNAVEKLGLEVAIEMSRKLLIEGAPSIHFATLNRIDLLEELTRQVA